MTSDLLEAASHQCKEENEKAYGEQMPKKHTLAVNFQKRWLNQKQEFDMAYLAYGGEKMCLSDVFHEDGTVTEKEISCDRFQNVVDHAPELVLPRCALFTGINMKEKRIKMRHAIMKALVDEEEEDELSFEDLLDDEMEYHTPHPLPSPPDYYTEDGVPIFKDAAREIQNQKALRGKVEKEEENVSVEGSL